MWPVKTQKTLIEQWRELTTFRRILLVAPAVLVFAYLLADWNGWGRRRTATEKFLDCIDAQNRVIELEGAARPDLKAIAKAKTEEGKACQAGR
jgi:hypothetical protein